MSASFIDSKGGKILTCFPPSPLIHRTGSSVLTDVLVETLGFRDGGGVCELLRFKTRWKVVPNDNDN